MTASSLGGTVFSVVGSYGWPYICIMVDERSLSQAPHGAS